MLPFFFGGGKLSHVRGNFSWNPAITSVHWCPWICLFYFFYLIPCFPCLKISDYDITCAATCRSYEMTEPPVIEFRVSSQRSTDRHSLAGPERANVTLRFTVPEVEGLQPEWSKQTSKKQLKGPTGRKSHVHLCALGQLCLRFAACWDVEEAVGLASPFVSACSRPCRISRPDQLVAVSAFRTSPCPYMQHTIYCIHIQYTYSKKHIHTIRLKK